MAKEDIERWFPAFQGGNGYVKTSDESEEYNCFAWAAGITNKRIDPTEAPNCDWPDGIAKSYDLTCFEEFYKSKGFELCDNHQLKPGFVKIALYEDKLTGEATHAARQLESGKWTSKLGDYDDITHDALESLEGPYGTFVRVMKKKAI